MPGRDNDYSVEGKLLSYITVIEGTILELEKHNAKLLELDAADSKKYFDNKLLINAYELVLQGLEEISDGCKET